MQPLILYHQALESSPVQDLLAYLEAPSATAYLDLARTIYTMEPPAGPTADPLQNHLLERLLLAENAFTRGAATGTLPPALLEAAAYDLRQLQRLYRQVGEVERPAGLPTWSGWVGAPAFATPAYRAMARRLTAAPDWGELAQELADFHRAAGVGLIAKSWFLRWTGESLQAVADPDLIDLEQLTGLVPQKAAILANTAAFVAGAPGNSLLLYGPRGTGKSSLVRALAPRFGEEGFRLVEAGREALPSLGELFRRLKQHPQRFVLFLDDLAFESDDAEYRAFKSTLEGALERRPANVLLYATTNRRHMIPERWSDRNSPETAEVHGQDAMEEKLSLADRFAQIILFQRPNQEEYLQIVEHLAARRGLAMAREELRQAAIRWALWHNLPSGRTARQFLDDLVSRLGQGSHR